MYIKIEVKSTDNKLRKNNYKDIDKTKKKEYNKIVQYKERKTYMEKTDFGRRIRKLRIDKGYSMQDLANKLNVTKSSINMWENSNSIPKDNILIALSKIFNVSIDYLLGNEKMEEKVPENKTLHYIQRNLEKLDEQKLKQAEKILQTVFDDIFEDGDDEDDDI